MKKVMSQFTQYEIADHTARRLRAEAFRSGTAAMLGVLRRAFFWRQNEPAIKIVEPSEYENLRLNNQLLVADHHQGCRS